MEHDFSLEIVNLLKSAENERLELHHPYVGSEHLFLALLKEMDSIKNILLEYGISYDRFKKELIRLIGVAKKKIEFIRI